jgi:hypothetical protein
MTLTPDEQTVLIIAAKGEPMMPVGRWRDPANALVAKGFLRPRPHPGDPTGFSNLHITPQGQAAADDLEKQDDEALRDMITGSNAIGHSHAKIRAQAEAIAVQMVDLVEASIKVTGETKQTSLENWARVILKRALELVR